MAAFELGSALGWMDSEFCEQNSKANSSRNNERANDERRSCLSEAIACYEKASEISSFDPSGTVLHQTSVKEIERLKLEI